MEQGEKNTITENKEQPKPRLLFVDDVPINIELDLGDLNRANPQLLGKFQIEYLSEALNLKEAVEKILELNPNTTLMDNSLGGEFHGVHGPDIIRALREVGFAGTIIGNSTGGDIPFREGGVMEMMDGFLPGKNIGLKDFLENLLKRDEKAD